MGEFLITKNSDNIKQDAELSILLRLKKEWVSSLVIGRKTFPFRKQGQNKFARELNLKNWHLNNQEHPFSSKHKYFSQ